MNRLIDAIIAKWFCLHEWEESGRLVRVFGRKINDLPTGFEQTYLCKKCGKFKKVSL